MQVGMPYARVQQPTGNRHAIIVAMAVVVFLGMTVWPTPVRAESQGIGPAGRLWEAASRCDTHDVDAILASASWSAAVVLPDGRGTALHAVARGPSTGACLAVAAALMRAGTDPLATDAAGHTAVDVAKTIDAIDQRPDRPPMGLFLASMANGERADIMRRHGPLEGDVARAPH
ncbi:Ankyrin repeat incomplete domain containing protein [Pandoravirus quercus]|uniref:Ankyrin repeat incomplete domain containing protein n=2 Tax=Pandoravirus TaxID=2060084 RepID=A0A2U7U7U8_9VIRU|nr:Ankyrin repeat incomplete domain containing protein [Pandoravirus quercus]AVK74508.1 Ankyrin repeat incomplete domain containing protein [Pandoravirus quercus]QBZ80680.1 ankyrin repeat incomplete domain containing protein [Pandoravirus celtis]